LKTNAWAMPAPVMMSVILAVQTDSAGMLKT
jgi:hypothetical protein